MSTPINIKVTLANGTEQLNIAEPGKTLRVKAVGKGQFQVVDPKTGKAPDAFTAKRVGKDLLITVSDAEGAQADVVIEDFAEVEGATLVGEASNGVFYEYIPTTDLGLTPAWSEGQAFSFATDKALATSSALVGVPFLATPLAGLGVLGAGAAGVGLANAQGADSAPATGGTGATGGTDGTTGGNANPGAVAQAIQNAVNRISTAAQLNNAGSATLSLTDFTAAGVTGVRAENLQALSSVLNSLAIDGAAVNTTAKIQALVNALNAVLGGAASGPAPTLEQLQLLGLKGINADNLAAVQAAIRNTPDNGSGADSIDELQGLIDGITQGVQALSAIAEDNTASSLRPDAAAYAKAGITGVNASNLASINSVPNSSAIDGAAVDTPLEIQNLVNSYKDILAAADGTAGNPAQLTQAQYAQLGVTGINTPQKLGLLNDVIDRKTADGVDTQGELQGLADAVVALMNAANGVLGVPSLEQLLVLGVKGVTPSNLEQVQLAIRNTDDNGSGVARLQDLQNLVPAVPPALGSLSARAAIARAADDNNATEGKPSLTDYSEAGGAGNPGVTGVDAGNLAAINSLLNTPSVTGAQLGTVSAVQNLVNAYNKVLAAADGVDNNAPKPTPNDYLLMGITGVNSPQKESLLGDLLDIKTKGDVDSAAELQQLANAVNAVIVAAAGGAGPNLAQLQALGFTDLSPAQLAAVQAAIKTTPVDGSGVDSLGELQALVAAVGAAFSAIADAALSNNATPSYPSSANYAKIGVTGVDGSNLAAINSVLNRPVVNDVAVDTAAEIQAVVDAYKAVLAAADGQANDAPLTRAQFEKLGITGIDTPQKEALLKQVIDGKTAADVDTAEELQKLADAVAAVAAAAAGGDGPSLEQLQELGVKGITPKNLAEVQKAIRESKDDGSDADSLSDLQALVAKAQLAVPAVTTSGLAAIAEAARTDNATEGKPSLADYRGAGTEAAPDVTGVNAGNLAAINSVLNTAAIGGGQVDTKEKIQKLVDAYNKVLAAADGSKDKDAVPSSQEYALLGVAGVDTPLKQNLLGEVIDAKLKADVDSAAELQALADAVSALVAAATTATGTGPSLEQLQELGLQGVNPANLAAVQLAIKKTPDDGSGVSELDKVQKLVDEVNEAFDTIRQAAANNNASETSPSAQDYGNAGVLGVNANNLAAVNSVLNTPRVDGAAVDTTPEIQALVDAYAAVLSAADGQSGNGVAPTQTQYDKLGVSGVDTPQKLALLGQVLDGKTNAAVDSVGELQKLADAVAAVMAAAAGGSGPSLEQLQALGVAGVNPKNLAEVQKAIQATNNDGTGADSLGELNALVAAVTGPNGLVPAIPLTTINLAAITLAAQENNASEGKPTLSDYLQAGGPGNTGVTGVTTDNLAAINSALNTAAVNGESVNTVPEVQALVDAYNKVLAAADGKNDNDSKPTAAEYARLGITGVAGGNDADAKANLLGDAIDTKTKAEVDSAGELQKLADAAAAVLAGAVSGNPAPSLEQLQSLGLKGLNPANLLAVQEAIKKTADNGSGVDSLAEVQGLINGVNEALGAIRLAAQDNKATESNPSADDYAIAGVTGVNTDNLAALNSALNTPNVNGTAVDTAPQIQALVNAYELILNMADGLAGNGAKPTQAQYELLGVTGVNSPQKTKLLGEVIDLQTKAGVDSVAELQKLADAVSAVMAAAAGGTGPSLEQLHALGLSNVSPANLLALQTAIRDSNNDGSQVDELSELRSLVSQAQATVPPITATGLAAITQAAEQNSAISNKPSLSDYLQAGGPGNTGVSGVTTDNLAAINSALNTAAVNGESVNTVPEVQALVNAYNKVLAAADGKDDNDAKPTTADYELLGITGLSGSNASAKENLLGDVIDVKVKADVDSAGELQKLADAVATVLAAAAGGVSPSLEQLKALGLKNLNPDNLDMVLQAIQESSDDGAEVDSLAELQDLVDALGDSQRLFGAAFDIISDSAESDSATEDSPSATDYAMSGVTGVDESNLAAINSALNTSGVDGAAVDETPELQALVDAYQAVLNAADGSPGNGIKPTQDQYKRLGIVGVDTPQEENLLGQVIDAKTNADVDTVGELQQLADAVAAVMAAAAGGTGPSQEQLLALDLTGVYPANLAAIQEAIRDTDNNGSGVDTLDELKALVSAAQTIAPPVPANVTGLDAIKAAALGNNATEGKPTLADYQGAGGAANPVISGVTAGNLAAINSVLNTAGVSTAQVDTVKEVQDLVNAYIKVLAAADGKDDNDAKPTAAEYALLGITGLTASNADAKASLLGDVIDTKVAADVDSAVELQQLADAAAAVIDSVNPSNPSPSLEQLQALGIKGLSPANLAAVQAAIKATPANGSGVDSLAELQALVSGVGDAFRALTNAAEANNATETSPSTTDYAKAGATGVTDDNLAAINSALNTPRVDGGAVDTTPQVQALVDAYKAILAAADGVKDNGRKPTADEFALVGISGITSPQKEALLGEVIDGKTSAAVDTAGELQKLADAVVAVQTAAAGGSGPSLEQLQALGVTGVTPKNLAEVQKAIQATHNDGSQVDSLKELNDLVAVVSAPNGPVPAITATGLSAISEAAEQNNASESKPNLLDYRGAGTEAAPDISGVNADNLAAINSALNTPDVTGDKANSKEEVQALVNAYIKVLAAADGVDNNPVKPSSDDYTALGITGLDSAPKLSLLGDVLDTKAKADVDSAPELQQLADAVAAVIAGTTANSTPPSLEQLQSLGIQGLNPGNLSAVQAALKNSVDGGADVDTLPELQALVDGVAKAQSAISDAAQANNATDTRPSAADYAQAGVTGVGTENLAAINSALNSPSINGAAVDSTPEIQALVDAFQSILDAADGRDDNDAKPEQAAYARVGVNGVNTPQKQSLLGDVIDVLGQDAVDSVPELQKLADAVAAVMTAAAGGTGPSLEQLQALGLKGLTPKNLAEVQKAIQDTDNDGTGADTLGELQALVAKAIERVPAVSATGLNAITLAAQENNATEGKPGLSDYLLAGGPGNTGVTGVTTDNLAAINSALNTAAVNGESVNTVPEVQALVNAYIKVLAAADGKDDNDTKPTAAEYARLGITGVEGGNTEAKQSLLGDVLDIKDTADVDSAGELQKLADAVAAVVASAVPGAPNASLEQLLALGLTDLNLANLAAVQAAIKGTPADGSGVDTLPELQALVKGVANAQSAISDAAQANSATETSPRAADYAQAGVSGVDAANLAAVNSALNTPLINGAAVDTTPEIQALVDAYKAVLAAADGTPDNDPKPTQDQYRQLGITGINTPQKESLLGDVIDRKPNTAVDTAGELQALADAVAAVMAAAAGGTGPSEEQLKALGVLGVNPSNLAAVQLAIKNTPDNGSAVDTLSKLQALVATPPAPTASGLNAITQAAQDNNATEGRPALADYLSTGVSGSPTITGVDINNLAAINSALNTPAVNGDKTDTVAEVQDLVNAYVKVLNAADGVDNNATKPTTAELGLLGITGITGSTAAAIESLLGDVLDIKAKADVDSAIELQKLADAVAAVIASTAPSATSPSLEQLQALGLSNLNLGNLAAVQAAIKATAPDGTGVDTLPELQALVNGVEAAFNAISDAAQANNATETSPSAADYAKAGVTGVSGGNAGNLAAINSALNSPLVDGAAVDTRPEIQDLVNAYNAILAAADATNDDDRKPTAQEYALVGVSGITTPQKESLLGDVIDIQAKAAVDTIPELQKLADAVAAVMAAAAGGTGPSEEQLKALGVTGVTPLNLAAVQAAIKATDDSGSAVDTLAELQALTNTATAPTAITATGLAAITLAAQANNATESKPSLADYQGTGGAANPAITGVDANNLAAINSALNTPTVDGAKTDSLAEVQDLVNAYVKVLAAADGQDNNAAKPTEAEYLLLGVTGTDSAPELSLLGDVLDIKAKADVDTAGELQKLADAVAAVIAGANAANPSPSLEQLQALGLTGLNEANLVGLQDAIRASNDTGTDIDTLPKLQALLGNTDSALNAISAAAQANNANDTTPSADIYAKAGVTGVTGGNTGNLAAINSALNTPSVNGAAVDTTPEIQALVNAYQAVLTAADATNDDDRKPTVTEYALIGVNGVNTPQKESLLGDVVDIKPQTAVDTVPELQALADAVAAVMSAANGGATPSLAQFQQDLGLTEVTAANLAAVLAAIAATDNDGSQVDTLDEIKALISQLTTPTPPAPPVPPSPPTFASNPISNAAQNNNATATTPTAADYAALNVTGVSATNTELLGALASALNSAAVNGPAADTTAEVQELVNAYAKILADADGINNVADTAGPTQEQFSRIGVVGVDTAAEVKLLGDVIDTKAKGDVNTVAELQVLADAVAAVMANAANSPTLKPTSKQLQDLGVTGVNDGNLSAVQAAITGTNDVTGQAVDTVAELQALVNALNRPTAINRISTAAQNDTADPTTPSVNDYTTAGVTDVTANNLGAMNSALNTSPVNAAATDTTAKIQTLVNAYKAILAAADGSGSDTNTDPSKAQFEAIGVTGLNATNGDNLARLLGDVVDRKANADVATVPQIQALANIAAAVLATAAPGGTIPTVAQLTALGVSGVTDGNLTALRDAILATDDTGAAVDTVKELQDLINSLTPPTSGPTFSSNPISNAAQNDNATATTPAAADYIALGVTGVTASNTQLLGALASALNSAGVNGPAADTTNEVQELVNAYAKILDDADGINNVAEDAGPTQLQFSRIGVVGVNDANKAKLLGDVIDIKADEDVNTVAEIQVLADAVDGVLGYATRQGTGDKPSLPQLLSLGLVNLNEGNLAALQAAIAATAADGTGVNTVPKLQALLNGINQERAIDKIEAAALANDAVTRPVVLSDYLTAGATAALQENVASYNDALNRPQVTNTNVDSKEKIEQLVAAYNAILTLADESALTNTSVATQAQYTAIGVTGLADTNGNRTRLLNDAIDIKAREAVDTVKEIQDLSDIVNAVMTGAPTLADFEALGLEQLSEGVIPAVNAALRASRDANLNNVDTRAELQTLINTVLGTLLPVTNPIVNAAENDSADDTTPTLQNYVDVGVLSGPATINASNLAVINTALNSDRIQVQATNSRVKIQAIVDAYVRILNAADGVANNQNSAALKLTANDFKALYVTEIDTPNEVSLVGDVIDRTEQIELPDWEDLLDIADAAETVINSVTDPVNFKPKSIDFDLLQVEGVKNTATLSLVRAAITATNDVALVDTVPELQRVVISALAEANLATNNGEVTPVSLTWKAYQTAGATGIAANVSSYNSALDTSLVTGASVNTEAKLNALTSAYDKVLAAADTVRNTAGAAAPSAADFNNLGVSGFGGPSSAIQTNTANLLSDAIDIKAKTAVDQVPELQALANAAAAVMAYAALATAPSPASSTAPTQAQLEALGVLGIDATNLSVLQAAIANSPNDGSGVNTVPLLQALIGNSNVTVAINKIADAAENNSANDAANPVVLTDYRNTGAQAIAANVPSYNDVLNTPFVTRERADTGPKIVGLVSTYNKILESANGSTGNVPAVSATEYTNLGVTGFESATSELLVNKTDLLNDAIDAKTFSAVDQVSELQALASAAIAIMNFAALPSNTTPTAAQATALNTQLALLGVTGVNSNNLSPLLTAIAGTTDDGSGVDSVQKIQNLVSGNTDVTAPTVRSVVVQSATTSLGSGFSKVTDEGDTITFKVTMSESVTVTGTPTLAFLMGSTPKTAIFSSVSGSEMIFTYPVLEGDFDHNGISLPAGTSTTGLVGGSIQDGNNNVANRSYAAVSDQAAFRVDALSLDANNGTSNGLLIRGFNSNGQWYFAWDANANGTMFASSGLSVDIGDQRPFRSTNESLLTPLRALKDESNPSIEISLITPTQYQTIAANNGWPTANWSSTNQAFWAFDSNLDDGSQAFFRARFASSLNDTVTVEQTTLLTSFAVI